jgi:hypothetical protein
MHNYSDTTKNWRQLERLLGLCKLIERKPGKVNEIPLKVNETPGSQGQEKTPENEKTGAGKTERP